MADTEPFRTVADVEGKAPAGGYTMLLPPKDSDIFPTRDDKLEKELVRSRKAEITALTDIERQRETSIRNAEDRQKHLDTAIGADLSEFNKPWNAQQELDKRQHSLWEQFGSPAFLIAMMASAFSAQPMNSALTAGGAAINAMNQGDMDSYEKAFKAWKENTELVHKRMEIEEKEWDRIEHLKKDNLDLWEAQARAVAARFGDERAIAMIEAGMSPELWQARAAMSTAKKNMLNVQNSLDERKLYGEFIRARVGDKGMSDPIRLRAADEEFKHPTNDGLVATIRAARNEKWQKGEGELTTKELQDVIRKYWEDRGKISGIGELYRHARMITDDPAEQVKFVNEQLAKQKMKPVDLKPETIDMRATMARRGNPDAFRGLTRNASDVAAIADRMMEQAKAEGKSPDEAADEVDRATIKFAAMRRGEVALALRSANITSAATQALATAPRVTETSRKVNRTKYKDLNAFILAAKESTADENVVRYSVALNTFISQYARARANASPGGATTDSVRREVHDDFNKAWAVGQIDAAIDQAKIELKSELHGALVAQTLWENQEIPSFDTEASGTNATDQLTPDFVIDNP